MTSHGTTQQGTTRVGERSDGWLILRLALLVLMLGFTTSASAFTLSDCPAQLACQVTTLATEDGHVVVSASVRWPTDQTPGQLPRHAWIRVDRVDYAAVAITWSIVDYATTCPSETVGALVAVVAPGALSPGSIIEADFGTEECKALVPRDPRARSWRGPTDVTISRGGRDPSCNDTGVCDDTLETDGPQVSGILLLER